MSEGKEAAAPALSDFTKQLAASTGWDIKDLQRNALGKQYTIEYGMNVTEADTGKKYFTGFPIVYHGVPYPVVVLMEAAFIELFKKLNQAAREIATGGEAPPT